MLDLPACHFCTSPPKIRFPNQLHVRRWRGKPMNTILSLSEPQPLVGLTPVVSLGVQAHSTISLSLAEAQALRKSIPSWAPPETPGHFFKYSDEQTIVAAQAVDRLIQAEGISTADCREWGVVVAPRYIGRLAGAGIFDRFRKRGDQGVSPHTLPQHSLHSPSGALSILLGTHGPNAGMGGGPNAFAEGLLGALTMFDLESTPGLWLVATEWNPEPLPDEQGEPATAAVCHGLAMLLRPASAAGLRGQLSLRTSHQAQAGIDLARRPTEVRLHQLVHALDIAAQRNLSLGFEWQLRWGGRIEMRLEAASGIREVAA
jgi:hypothetical protein